MGTMDKLFKKFKISKLPSIKKKNETEIKIKAKPVQENLTEINKILNTPLPSFDAQKAIELFENFQKDLKMNAKNLAVIYRELSKTINEIKRTVNNIKELKNSIQDYFQIDTLNDPVLEQKLQHKFDELNLEQRKIHQSLIDSQILQKLETYRKNFSELFNLQYEAHVYSDFENTLINPYLKNLEQADQIKKEWLPHINKTVYKPINNKKFKILLKEAGLNIKSKQAKFINKINKQIYYHNKIMNPVLLNMVQKIILKSQFKLLWKPLESSINNINNLIIDSKILSDEKLKKLLHQIGFDPNDAQLKAIQQSNKELIEQLKIFGFEDERAKIAWLKLNRIEIIPLTECFVV